MYNVDREHMTQKPEVQCGQRKAHCKDTSCCPFQETLSLFFPFAPSILPTRRDSDWKRVQTGDKTDKTLHVLHQNPVAVDLLCHRQAWDFIEI